MINDEVIKLIEKYQNNKALHSRPRCVHYPTCSAYGKECYQKFNFFYASLLTFKRILFCTPLNKKCYDPTPLTKEEKKKLNYLINLYYQEVIEIANTIDNNIDLIMKKLYERSFSNNSINYETFNALCETLKKAIKKNDIKLPYLKTKKIINNLYVEYIKK